MFRISFLCQILSLILRSSIIRFWSLLILLLFEKVMLLTYVHFLLKNRIFLLLFNFFFILSDLVKSLLYIISFLSFLTYFLIYFIVNYWSMLVFCNIICILRCIHCPVITLMSYSNVLSFSLINMMTFLFVKHLFEIMEWRIWFFFKFLSRLFLPLSSFSFLF